MLQVTTEVGAACKCQVSRAHLALKHLSGKTWHRVTLVFLMLFLAMLITIFLSHLQPHTKLSRATLGYLWLPLATFGYLHTQHSKGTSMEGMQVNSSMLDL